MNLQADRIAGLCDALQLGWVAAEYDAIAQTAATESMTFSDYLERVLRVEVEGRHERAKQTLLKMATLPGIKTPEDYEYTFAGAPKAQIQELSTLAFIERAENVVLLDRLLHHGHIVTLKGESYRLKDKRKAGMTTSGKKGRAGCLTEGQPALNRTVRGVNFTSATGAERGSIFSRR